MEYKLVIDQKVVDDYNTHYFRLHPRAKKPPIERPIMPSLNQIMILQRVQIAALKAKYKEFGMWFVKSLGYENLQLDRFEMEIKVYMPSRRKADVDNHCGSFAKLILDSFTESGFIVDDDYLHLVKITMSCGYDKDNPRSEILIKTIGE